MQPAREYVLPASFGEERLWFLDQLNPGVPVYNVALAATLRGRLDVTCLERALQAVADRHETLRTRLATRGGDIVQIVADRVALPLPVERVPRARADGPELARMLEEEARRPFDLTAAPLARARLFRLSRGEHVLSLTLHHAICDSSSLDVLLRDLAECYRAFDTGARPRLPELPLQYGDFASWQRELVTGDRLADQIEFWTKRLSGFDEPLDLPADLPRRSTQTFAGALYRFALPDETTGELLRLAQANQTTAFVVYLAAFQIFLARYSGQSRIVVASPASERPSSELENLIGFFVNLMLFPAGELEDDPAFLAELARLRNFTVEAHGRRDLPFERLVQELRPPRDLSRSPLFQAMLVLEPELRLDLPGVASSVADVPTRTSKYDLTLFLRERGSGLDAAFEYSTDLFEASTIARMARHFVTLLHGIAAAPDTRVSELPLLTRTERDALVSGLNPRSAAPPERATVVELFDRQVAATPDAEAVSDGTRALTYEQLNRQSSAFARSIRELAPDARIVAIALERSVELPVAVLAVLKAGASYLALDPEYPPRRLEQMLEDARASLVLTERAIARKLPEPGIRVVLVDDLEAGAAAAAGRAAERPRLLAASPAYVIYTSGSTGTPKGVVMTHGALANLIAWQRGRSRAGPGTRTLQFTSLSFDVAFQELFATWCSGGTLVVVDAQTRRDPARLAAFLVEHRIDRMFLPFVALNELARELAAHERPDAFALREVVTAGEQLRVTPAIAAAARRIGFSLDNQYGPSETHVVTAHRLAGDPSEWPALPPIGTPVDATAAYVLDRRQQPVPLGVPGDLWIGGVAVGGGYLRRPAETAASFRPDPFRGAGARMYRTGDVARSRADGSLEFVRRADDQVKIRGHRVEPGELEAILSRCPGVAEVAVAAREDPSGGRALVAYVVPAGGDVAPEDVLGFARERLPDVMVPAQTVMLVELPRMPSGKIDRRALPAPDWTPATVEQEPPASELETTIALIWGEFLGAAEIARHANFFELGGHSLSAVRIVSAVRRTLRADIGVDAIFDHPTLAVFAAAVAGAPSLAAEEPAVRRLPRVPAHALDPTAR